MKNINIYLKESLEESNYLLWQLDQWFNQHDEEKQEFINIVVNCINDHTINNVEKYLNETFYLKNDYQELVIFILDDPNIIANKEINYLYNFKEIIKQLMNNKSSKNKYNKK